MIYQYGNAWERYPIELGEAWGLPDGSRVAVHDIFDPLPSWLHADLLFVDPPYNPGQLHSYYTKAALPLRGSYNGFADVLFNRITEIGAWTAYIEIGSQHADNWHDRLAAQFRHVQRWPVTYYRRHPTHLIRGSHVGPVHYDFTGLDEARCIRILTVIEDYKVIADPCMGRGQVGTAAYRAGRPFVGTELHKRRLACLLNRLGALGANVEKY